MCDDEDEQTQGLLRAKHILRHESYIPVLSSVFMHRYGWEVAQSIKYVLHKQEDLSLSPRIHEKKPSTMMCACNLRGWGQRQVGLWPDGLA